MKSDMYCMLFTEPNYTSCKRKVDVSAMTNVVLIALYLGVVGCRHPKAHRTQESLTSEEFNSNTGARVYCTKMLWHPFISFHFDLFKLSLLNCCLNTYI